MRSVCPYVLQGAVKFAVLFMSTAQAMPMYATAPTTAESTRLRALA